MNSNTPQLLIIDDDPNIIVLLEELLFDNYDVTAATDGLTGAFLAYDGNPDLILLDLKMRRIDGWDVLFALKESDKTKGIPIVILTADHSAENRQLAFERGCQGFLGKPIDEDLLFSTLTSAISDARSSRNDFSTPSQ